MCFSPPSMEGLTRRLKRKGWLRLALSKNVQKFHLWFAPEIAEIQEGDDRHGDESLLLRSELNR